MGKKIDEKGCDGEKKVDQTKGFGGPQGGGKDPRRLQEGFQKLRPKIVEKWEKFQ